MSSCSDCLSSCFPEDDTPIESFEDADEPEMADPEGAAMAVQRLRIIPDEVHVAPGTTFTLRLRAWDAFGKRIAVPAGITWSSPAAVTFSGSDPVTVSVPGSLSTSVFSVVATDGSTSSSPAKVFVAAGSGDRLALPHVAGASPEAAILDAGEGVNCVGDQTVMVVSDADLGRNFTPGCPEPPEVALFSQSAGGQFEPGSALTGTPGTVPPWTTLPVDVLSRTTLPSVRTVPVSLRVRTSSATSDGNLAVTHIVTVASAIYQLARAGVSFSVADRVDGGPATVPKSICGSPADLATYGVDVTLTRLYVLVVNALTGGTGLVGWTCDIPPGQNAQVILVAAVRDHTTVAHEFGHALGINKPIGLSGHAGSSSFNMTGLAYPNLMWTNVDDTYDVPRRELTLGQVFRMNVHEGSWLARLTGAGPTKPCQCKHYTSDPCPALDLDVPGTDSPPGNNLLCVI